MRQGQGEKLKGGVVWVQTREWATMMDDEREVVSLACEMRLKRLRFQVLEFPYKNQGMDLALMRDLSDRI
jgi:hypothetical protein